VFELRGESSDFQWWLANDAGLRRLLDVSGFRVQQTSTPFLLRPGVIGRTGTRRPTRPREVATWLGNWAFTHDATVGGHLHRAYRCRPRF
jgi:hypothetical protein